MEKLDCDKYTVYDILYNEQYFFQFGRLSLNGTYWAEYWDNQVNFKMGIHIDLFILDKVPNNKFKRLIYMRRCLLLCKLCSISSIKIEDHSTFVKFITSLLHFIFNFIGLTPKYYQKKIIKVI